MEYFIEKWNRLVINVLFDLSKWDNKYIMLVVTPQKYTTIKF